MLLALRSLYEPTVVVVVPPGGGGGGGGSAGVGHGLHPFRPIIPRPVPAFVTLRPARAKFRAGELEATGGANAILRPVVGRFSLGKLEATGAASVQTESARAKFQPGKITATGIDNDPLIAISLLDL